MDSETYAPFRENFLSDLPFDIQLILIKHLGPEGTGRLLSVNKSLRKLALNENIWKTFLCAELGCSLKDVPPVYTYAGNAVDAAEGMLRKFQFSTENPYYSIYAKLVHRFRGCFNKLLWNKKLIHGELLTITFNNGLLEGRLWWPSKEVLKNLIPQLDFIVFLREGGEVPTASLGRGESLVLKYGANQQEPTVAVKFDKSAVDQNENSGFIQSEKIFLNFRNLSRYYYSNEALMRLDNFFQVSGVSGNNRMEHILESRYPGHPKNEFSAFGDFGVKRNCYKPEWLNPIMPKGIFKGTYGLHGTELLRVFLEESSSGGAQKLIGKKLKGDPNVPAGENSFEFSLDRCVLLSDEQQDNLQDLENLHLNGVFYLIESVARQHQAFRIPEVFLNADGHFHFDKNLVPNVCQLRVVGLATIAETGFLRPQSVPAQLILLSPTRFLVLWMGLHGNLSLFEKISENDPICAFL